MKQCTKCKEEKPLGDFSRMGLSVKTGKRKYSSWCKLCKAKDQKMREGGDPTKGTVDPKWLTRGTVSNNKRDAMW